MMRYFLVANACSKVCLGQIILNFLDCCHLLWTFCRSSIKVIGCHHVVSPKTCGDLSFTIEALYMYFSFQEKVLCISYFCFSFRGREWSCLELMLTPFLIWGFPWGILLLLCFQRLWDTFYLQVWLIGNWIDVVNKLYVIIKCIIFPSLFIDNINCRSNHYFQAIYVGEY